MNVIALIGRILFSLMFLLSGFNHFRSESVEYAASQGVPAASFLVPASGVLALLGALSVIFGYRARIGGWLLVLFLIPVTLMMHQFWDMTDAAMSQNQMAHFMKNLSMLGGALLIAYFGAGPLSLDEARKVRATADASKKNR
jgi:putative oxidoreductase